MCKIDALAVELTELGASAGNRTLISNLEGWCNVAFATVIRHSLIGGRLIIRKPNRYSSLDLAGLPQSYWVNLPYWWKVSVLTRLLHGASVSC